MIAAAETNIKSNSAGSTGFGSVYANSRQISSNQQHLHPRLADVVLRHLAGHDRKPLSDFNRKAFEKLHHALDASGRPLVIDSFCGTGLSTRLLARRHPHHLVVGIDKSASRLSRHVRGEEENYLLLQADCEAVWRQLSSAGIYCAHHYLLYPNPWPRSKHLGRRIHGHPALPSLLQLGGVIELRSNWQIYVEEFALALHLAGYRGSVARLPATGEDLTLFEAKYRSSGHDIWVARALLGSRDGQGFMG